MEEIILQNEAKSETFSEFLNQQFFPQVKDQLLSTNNYLVAQKKDFGEMDYECETLLMQLVEKKSCWGKNLQQLSDRNLKELGLQTRWADYKTAKSKELAEKKAILDNLISNMKEVCSKVKPDLISKMKLPIPQEIINAFTGIFQVLYDKPKESFSWDDFKKNALLLEKGEDFQSRLANFSLSNVPKEKTDILQMIESDQVFSKHTEDPKYTPCLLDISEWVTFAINGIKYAFERQETQNEYDKLCRDFDTRSRELKSTQKSQEFWDNSYKYADDQIQFLSSLSSIFKGVQNDVSKSELNLKVQIDHFVKTTQDLQKQIEVPNF